MFIYWSSAEDYRELYLFIWSLIFRQNRSRQMLSSLFTLCRGLSSVGEYLWKWRKSKEKIRRNALSSGGSVKWNKKHKYCRIKTVSIYRKSSIWYMFLIFILQIKDIVFNAFELSMVLILFFLERTCWLSFSISGLTRMKNTGTSGWIGEWYVQGNSSNERKKGGG